MTPRLPAIPGPIAWGGLVLPLLWTGISYRLMGVVNPVLQDRVDWAWFIVSQFVFGVAAAVVVLRSEKIHILPAGRGPDQVADFVAGGGEAVVNRICEARWRMLTLLVVLTGGCDVPGKPREADRPAPADQVKTFDALFSAHCIGCHGADGRLGPAPSLNDPLFLAIVPDAELRHVISEGRP